MLLIANIPSREHFPKKRTLTHSEAIQKWLFSSFEVVATPHTPLQSEDLRFYSEVGRFGKSKTKQLQSSLQRGNPLNVTGPLAISVSL